MDLSSLRERLRKPSLPTEVKPAAGVLIRESDQCADRRLYDLPQRGLMRIGIEGPVDIEKTLFLDTETTGLSGGVGTVAFLVGMGRITDGVFHTKQILMKDYASEGMLLDAMSEYAEGCQSIVTFNGNTFDLPLIRTRCTMNRRRYRFDDLVLIDLLKPARKLWRRRLGSVRLSRLEEEILGSGREDDLPGSEAPKRFFAYLQNGDMQLLEGVIDHNRQDILSMGELLAEVCAAYAEPKKLRETADQLSMGLVLGKQGETDEAEELLRFAAKEPLSNDLMRFTQRSYRDSARIELDRMLKKSGRTEERIPLLEDMCRRRSGGTYPLVELAKIAEHEHKDYLEALRWACEAAKLSSDDEEKAALDHRIGRLKKKAEAERRTK